MRTKKEVRSLKARGGNESNSCRLSNTPKKCETQTAKGKKKVLREKGGKDGKGQRHLYLTFQICFDIS